MDPAPAPLAPEPPRRIGLVQKLLVAWASLALAFLGVELYLRATGYDPLSEALRGEGAMVRRAKRPDLGYELVPDTKGEGWGTVVEINSAGFRDREYPLEKGQRFRIVALGDSVTFGNRLELAETWPERLERGLNATGDAVDVLDLGVPGYDTCQEVAFLDKAGLRFHPDLVVLGFCVNDLGIVSITKTHAFEPSDRERLVYRSRIAQWLRVLRAERERGQRLLLENQEERYARAYAKEILPLDDDPALLQRLADLRGAMESAARGAGSSRRIARWYAMPTRIGRLEFAFDRLARLGREHGFQVVVLLIPFLEDDPFLPEGYAIVRDLADSFGFEVVEAEEAFRAHGLGTLRILAQDPVHPNAAGHGLLAEALEAALRERLGKRLAD